MTDRQTSRPDTTRPPETCRWARNNTTTCRTQDHCATCDGQPRRAEEQP